MAFVTLLFSVGLNLVMFVPAYFLGTDKLTDISYSLTFIIVAVFGFANSQQSYADVLISLLVGTWAVRLGGFLLYRVIKNKKDKRFDSMRGNFVSFAKFWLLQGISVWVIMLPTTLFYTSTKSIGVLSSVGICIWLAGLLLETTADIQKLRFRNNPANADRWISSGVWSISRHPNYLGEIMIWIGIYLFAAPSFDLPTAVVAIVGPVFITVLLMFISGVPILEKQADAKWGNSPEYQAYKQKTGVLLPRFSKSL